VIARALGGVLLAFTLVVSPVTASRVPPTPTPALEGDPLPPTPAPAESDVAVVTLLGAIAGSVSLLTILSASRRRR
jgi:hypothetical protein